MDRPENNFGFDDEEAHYRVVPHDHLRYQYKIVQILGSGTFGNAVKCVDLRAGKAVVVKVVRNDAHAVSQSQIEVEAFEA